MTKPATTKYDWSAAAQCRLIGKEVSRIDGPAKVSGKAVYTYDVNLPGMLFAKTVRCPYARAKVKSIDTRAALKVPGVKAVYVIQGPGTEIQWAGDDIVAVAAQDEHSAEMGMRAVKVVYTELPHLVHDDSLQIPNALQSYLKPMAPEVGGDVDKGFSEADVTYEGDYGMPVIVHSCLETHGVVAAWGSDAMQVHISTQSVGGIAPQLSQALSFSQNKIQVVTQYVGGGYGAKLAADRWGLAAAQLSKLARGAPVKLMLERRSEQEVAGCRPSAYAHVKVGAKKDGTLLAWQSESWSTGGIGGGSEPPLPYLFQIPNQHRQHTQIVNNIGSARSMRAPHHPQACLLTLCALDDLAAKLKMDPVQLLLRNRNLLAARAQIYEQELAVADELMGWSKRWRPRGKPTLGSVCSGLGVSMHAWPGKAHHFQCALTINPDGSVRIKAGTQDLGTGTRTVIAVVAAETLGLMPDDIQVAIGDSTFPPSAASGGSGTVGGAGAAVRRASVDALTQLFEKIASALNATPDQLQVGVGKVQVMGGATLSWKEACSKLGALPLSVTGQNPGPGVLTDTGVCGVQMADVSVDTGTGVVRINKIVAVQDCGLIIDRKTLMSQIHGCLIMGIGYSLYEEKVMDQHLGQMLNPDIEFYRLCGIGDTGELVVHLMSGPGYDERGIIGCGEPAVISPGAAISNAVANAIGVRVPRLPITPDKIINALQVASS
jgi:xanthine dehydrogenase YagR molybdenum-binding subunit